MELIEVVLDYLSHILINIGMAVEVLARFLPLVAAIFLMITFLTYLDEVKFRRISGSRISEIDSMSPEKYRLFLKTLLSLLGYTIENQAEEELEGEADEAQLFQSKISVDALITKQERRTAVFFVRKSNGVGTPILDRLQQAMSAHNCQAGLIINSGYFTPEEKKEAEARGIHLWNRDRLIRELLRVQGIEDPKGKDAFAFLGNFWRWLVRGS